MPVKVQTTEFTKEMDMIRKAASDDWHVYILQCSDGTFYTGATNDVQHRLTAHNSGSGARYTKSRRPVSLVYEECCGTRSAALKREALIKKLSRPEKSLLALGKNDPEV